MQESEAAPHKQRLLGEVSFVDNHRHGSQCLCSAASMRDLFRPCGSAKLALHSQLKEAVCGSSKKRAQWGWKRLDPGQWRTCAQDNIALGLGALRLGLPVLAHLRQVIPAAAAGFAERLRLAGSIVACAAVRAYEHRCTAKESHFQQGSMLLLCTSAGVLADLG